MQLRLIVHDIRSCHNVGSLLRTADGMEVEHVYLTGYTPYPTTPQDARLPHISRKLTEQIAKTALGAETSVNWTHDADVLRVIADLQKDGYQVVALEQAAASTPLTEYHFSNKTAILLGREVEGVDPALLAAVDGIVEIPMFGSKESFNVVQAAAMTLYHCRFIA